MNYIKKYLAIFFVTGILASIMPYNVPSTQAAVDDFYVKIKEIADASFGGDLSVDAGDTIAIEVNYQSDAPDDRNQIDVELPAGLTWPSSGTGADGAFTSLTDVTDFSAGVDTEDNDNSDGIAYDDDDGASGTNDMTYTVSSPADSHVRIAFSGGSGKIGWVNFSLRAVITDASSFDSDYSIYDLDGAITFDENIVKISKDGGAAVAVIGTSDLTISPIVTEISPSTSDDNTSDVSLTIRGVGFEGVNLGLSGQIDFSPATGVNPICGVGFCSSDDSSGEYYEITGGAAKTGIPNGTYYVKVIADSVTNPGSSSDSVTFMTNTSTSSITSVDAGASSVDRTDLTADTWFNGADAGDDDKVSFTWTDPSSPSDDTFYYEINSDSGGTIDGSESSTSNNYVDDQSISEGTTYFHVKAKNGVGTWSSEEKTFKIKYDKTNPATPTFSPDGGSTTSSYTVTVTSSDAGSGLNSLYCTTNGDTPTTASTAYASGATVTVTADATLKCIAEDTAGNESSVKSASYTYTAPASSSSSGSSGGGGYRGGLTDTPPATDQPSTGTDTTTDTSNDDDSSDSSSDAPGKTIIDPFTDTPGHWAESYINRLRLLGVVNGRSQTTGKFFPDDTITRAELLKIALLTFGIDVDLKLTDSGYNDVPRTVWEAAYVRIASIKNIIKRGDYFYPGQNITRAQALKILSEAAGLSVGDEKTDKFTDLSTDHWAQKYIAYAVKNGIVSGYDDKTFRPDALVTRAEAAKMAIKILDMISK